MFDIFNLKKLAQAHKERDMFIHAIEEWILYNMESSDIHPCPDLRLREMYRERAIMLTNEAFKEYNHNNRINL